MVVFNLLQDMLLIEIQHLSAVFQCSRLQLLPQQLTIGGVEVEGILPTGLPNGTHFASDFHLSIINNSIYYFRSPLREEGRRRMREEWD
jgi:hypothetical protein